MDTTHAPGSSPEELESALDRMEAADPADAPDIADEIVERLAVKLDGEGSGDGATLEATPGDEP